MGRKNSSILKKYSLIGLIMLIFVAIIGAAYYVYGSDAAHPSNAGLVDKPSITLNDIFENKLYARRNNASWISDTELLFRDQQVSDRWMPKWSDINNININATNNIICQFILG